MRPELATGLGKWVNRYVRLLTVLWLLFVIAVGATGSGLAGWLFDLAEACWGPSSVNSDLGELMGGVSLGFSLLAFVFPAHVLEQIGLVGPWLQPSRPEPYGFPVLTDWGLVLLYGMPTLAITYAAWRRRRSSEPCRLRWTSVLGAVVGTSVLLALVIGYGIILEW